MTQLAFVSAIIFLAVQNVKLSLINQDRDLLGRRAESLSATQYIFEIHKNYANEDFEQAATLTILGQLFMTVSDSDYGRQQFDYTIDELATRVLITLEVSSLEELKKLTKSVEPELYEALAEDDELSLYLAEIFKNISQENTGG